jgi:hypothetical protein
MLCPRRARWVGPTLEQDGPRGEEIALGLLALWLEFLQSHRRCPGARLVIWSVPSGYVPDLFGTGP